MLMLRHVHKPVSAWRRISVSSVFALCLSLLLIGTCPPGRAEGGDPYARRPLQAVHCAENIQPPTIDGDLSDPAWQRAAKASVFLDSQTHKPAPDQTEAYLMYDKTYIYVAFYCKDSQPDGIVARETVRDAQLFNDDTVEFRLDPFLTYKWEDHASFQVNPLGTRRTRMGGGRAGKLEWQGDWDAATRRVSDGWTAEMRIPWAILSYPRGRGQKLMGLNFRREQQRTKISSMWSDLGPGFFNEREGIWQGVEAPEQTWKPRFSALPYLLPTGQMSGGHSQFRAGLDLRYQPTPELTSVATINPDFASVEGAVESVGFSRSERFVPDKRPFFLEGRDYLELGEFYSIGSYFDSARITQVDTGLKLYGKMTPKTTLGMLGTIAVGHQANFVTQIRRELSPTAGANLMLLQRLAPGEDNTVGVFSANARKGKWSLNGEVSQSAGPGAGGMAWSTAVNLEDKNLFTTLRYRRVGASYLDRLGYVPFTDYEGWSSYTDWSMEWRHGYLRSFDMSLNPTFDNHLDGRPFRRQIHWSMGVETRDDYRFGINIGGGKFDQDTDFTYGFNIGGNVSNRFRQWSLFFTTGQLASKPYTAFGPGLSVRLFKKFDLALSTFLENYDGGVNQQHILTFNYELSPYRAWGGRLVVENAGTNFFLSYHNAGRGGMDTYFILGDPNAQRFSRRVMVKFVFAL
ncbi:MAG TPA: carbohydrate binding family 9 domain-containing protein [Chthonomonadaceae bacterium]|nr:carbohydrate binding family 9 domain-containing protein [Chthonomonadaceae bacterium]